MDQAQGLAGRAEAVIRRIEIEDVTAALAAGWRDYQKSFGYGLFFGGIYALAGAVLVWIAVNREGEHLIFPLVSAFLLVGPIVAVGLYEISRRLEAGLPLSAGAIFGAFTRHGGIQIAFMGFVLVFLALAWLKIATLIYAVYFGMAPMSFGQLIDAATGSVWGIQFLVLGNLVGGVLAVLVFALSVVAVPMLLDRDVDAISAMLTSLAAVRESPQAFISFAVIIVSLTGIGLVLGFVGLVVMLPVIGHATWHLYRRAIG
jgi:uncharacterized membrane protein